MVVRTVGSVIVRIWSLHQVDHIVPGREYVGSVAVSRNEGLNSCVRFAGIAASVAIDLENRRARHCC